MINPLISVIIGTYNPKSYILYALESIFSQSYKNIEVLLYNDGTSQYESFEHIRNALERYPHIKYIHSNENKGLSYALNECIDSSNGDYIVRMDDDDYSLPNRIQLQYEFLISNQDYDYVGSSAYLFDDEIYGFISLPDTPSMKDILQSRAFVHPSIMIKKKTLIDIGKYSIDTNVLRLEDMDLWVRLINGGKKGKNIRVPLLLYRENLNSISKRTIKFRFREYVYKISKSIEMKLGLSFLIYLTIKSFFLVLIPQQLYRFIRRRNYRLKPEYHFQFIDEITKNIRYIFKNEK